MMNRLNFGSDPDPGGVLDRIDELEIKLYRGKEGTCFSFKLSGGCGSMFANDDEEPNASPDDYAFLGKLLERFQRRPQLE